MSQENLEAVKTFFAAFAERDLGRVVHAPGGLEDNG